MKTILIIGGTRFVGRIVVERLLASYPNYKVTIFNRGISNKKLFQNEVNVDFIYGDRETKDINQIFNKKWDVVVDFMGYFPDSITYMLNHINKSIGRYIFISTISTYDLENPISTPITENGKLLKWKESDRTDSTWETYGQRKVACEDEIKKYKDLDYIILRPSLIYGKYDYSDRFNYWLYKVKNDERVEVPDDFDKLVNYTFSEDFAKVIIHFMESNHNNNVYNIVTHKAVSLSTLFEKTKPLLNSNCNIVSVKMDTNNDANIPLWFPNEYLEISSKILNEEFGLKFCTLEESLQHTVEYNNSINWFKPGNI